MRGELVEEAVLGPEDDGGAQDHRIGKGLAHALFAFAPWSRHIRNRHSRRRRWPRHAPAPPRRPRPRPAAILAAPSACTSSKVWPFWNRMPVRLITALRAHHGVGDAFGIGDVAFDEIDLADRAQRAAGRSRGRDGGSPP